MSNVAVDIVVVGGGIAGLWTLARLKQAGYNAVLIEQKALGAGQTLASQGMIHGGQRYYLTGQASEHGDTLAGMPERWDACFRGEGEIDLSDVAILSPKQYMWSPGGLTANVSSFFASKTLNARMQQLPRHRLPSPFDAASKFRGVVYEMNECVVDPVSVVASFARSYSQFIYHGTAQQFSLDDGRVAFLHVRGRDGESVEITAKAYVFAAGVGNEQPIKQLGLERSQPKTQRRALKQIVIRGREQAFFGHCITLDPRPRMTVSTHQADGVNYWYLGGIVAEYGLGKPDHKALRYAKKELSSLFPWLTWEQTALACIEVDRAEPYAKHGFFKQGPQQLDHDNVLFTWPTKMTFAPLLAQQVLTWVRTKDVSPTEAASKLNLSSASLANYPWLSLSFTPWGEL